MKMKDEPEVEEEEEEEEEEENTKEEHEEQMEDGSSRLRTETEPEPHTAEQDPRAPTDSCSKETKGHKNMSQLNQVEQSKGYQEVGKVASSCEDPSVASENEKNREELKEKKASGPSKFPPAFSSKYPEDDPDYCVWVPPEGQSGDDRTHLNDKYGY
ncbi:kanadaptin [Sigmodon hispidus]